MPRKYFSFARNRKQVMEYRIVVVDYDGPILDVRHRHYKCYSDILSQYGYSPLSITNYWDLKRQGSDLCDILKVSKAINIYDQFVFDWNVKIEDLKYLDLDLVQEGVVDVIGMWRELGKKILLSTMRKKNENLRIQLIKLRIMDLFDEVVTLDGGRGPVEKAAAVANVLGEALRENILWIGDTEVDIEAARQLNVDSCALTCGIRNRSFLLKNKPKYVEESLRSFSMNYIDNVTQLSLVEKRAK